MVYKLLKVKFVKFYVISNCFKLIPNSLCFKCSANGKDLRCALADLSVWLCSKEVFLRIPYKFFKKRLIKSCATPSHQLPCGLKLIAFSDQLAFSHKSLSRINKCLSPDQHPIFGHAPEQLTTTVQNIKPFGFALWIGLFSRPNSRRTIAKD